MTRGESSRGTISRQQARELDRRAIEEYGMTGAMLMENAGRNTADVLCRIGIAGGVTIVCGRGNNGGDGFVIARHLELRGHAVRVALFDDPQQLRGDAALNFHVLAKTDMPIDRVAGTALDGALTGASWIVDAMLGTGAEGDPREPYASAIERLNASGIPILAVDVPSGLDCDTGRAAEHTIRARHTVTFVAAKPGFLQAAAQPYLGQLHVVDIGAPRKLVDAIVNA